MLHSFICSMIFFSFSSSVQLIRYPDNSYCEKSSYDKWCMTKHALHKIYIHVRTYIPERQNLIFLEKEIFSYMFIIFISLFVLVFKQPISSFAVLPRVAMFLLKFRHEYFMKASPCSKGISKLK